jgi:hypothetical protein
LSVGLIGIVIAPPSPAVTEAQSTPPPDLPVAAGPGVGSSRPTAASCSRIGARRHALDLGVAAQLIRYPAMTASKTSPAGDAR